MLFIFHNLRNHMRYYTVLYCIEPTDSLKLPRRYTEASTTTASRWRAPAARTGSYILPHGQRSTQRVTFILSDQNFPAAAPVQLVRIEHSSLWDTFNMFTKMNREGDYLLPAGRVGRFCPFFEFHEQSWVGGSPGYNMGTYQIFYDFGSKTSESYPF